MLYASGVHASVFDAIAVLIAVAALGVLPIGPGVGAGAMVLILGSTGVAGVSAAGVLLTATGTVGGLAYGGWALADGLWSKRKARLRLLRAPADSQPSTSSDLTARSATIRGWGRQRAHRMRRTEPQRGEPAGIRLTDTAGLNADARASGPVATRRRASFRAGGRLARRRGRDRLGAGQGRSPDRRPVRAPRRADPNERRTDESWVGGGWVGWLGYGLGSRIEELPPGPPAPSPRPMFSLAYYDHVIVLDQGRWWFEALATPEREAALEQGSPSGSSGCGPSRRPRAKRPSPPSRSSATGRSGISTRWPTVSAGSPRASCFRPTCARGWRRG